MLTECIRAAEMELGESFLRCSPMKAIACYSASNPGQSNPQIVETVLIHLTAATNHNSSASSLSFLKLCLRYLYRFAVGIPGLNFLQICTVVLDLRATEPRLQNYCDLVLCKVAHALIVGTQMEQVWGLLETWGRNLGENYMDVRAHSYYPILLIMETADEWRFIAPLGSERPTGIHFDSLFRDIMELVE
jgi:hypothetical protein